MKFFGQNKANLFLILIILLATLLRLPFLSSHPIGFTPDEASFGYDAYSILKTGKDQWGKVLPITLRSFGDSKLPLYTYLTIPSVAVFGLNEFATRFPSAIIGLLAIYATYLMVKELFKDERLALFSSFLLAVSPWHVALSRGAFEANLTVFFMSLGVWAFLSKKYLLSSILFGLNIFSYHSARLVTPLIIGFLVFFNKEKFEYKKNLLSILVFTAFFVVAVWQVLHGGSSRAADVTIFNPTDKWMAVYDKRYEAVFDGMPNTVAKFFSNKITYLFDQFTNAYSTYLSPQFLFTLGPAESTYGMLTGHGVMYIFEFLFVITAFWMLALGDWKNNKFQFICFWILISIIPASLTKGPGYAGNRAAIMMPAIQILSAYGGIVLFDFLTKRFNKKVIKLGYISLFAIFMTFFVQEYLYRESRDGAEGMLYGREEMMNTVNSIEGNYKNIIISRSLSEPQIYVAFYGQYDPKLHQEASVDWLRYEKEGRSFLDQLGEYSLGKYKFKNINLIDDSKIPDVLIIGKPMEFSDKITPLEVIKYKNQNPAIVIYDPAKDVKSN